MIVDIVLNNARAYYRKQIVECSIAIEGEKIHKIGKQTNMPNADEKINLHNLLVLPGIVDTHVHLRDEGKAYKETFFTGTSAAASGGVTTLLDMPNNEPLTNNVEALHDRMQLAERRVVVDVGFYSEFPPVPENIEKIAEAGALGFKLFMAEKIGGIDIDDDQALINAFQHAAELKIPVAVHAEDHIMLKNAVDYLKLNNRHDLNAFLRAHTDRVEVEAVKRLLKLKMQAEKMHLHLCHLSTEESLVAVTEKKENAVTCEVTPHHLLLSKEDLERLGGIALTMPPLRGKEQVEALWKGIADGRVDTVGSDHAPHTLQEKDASSIWDVKVGIPGVETLLPIMLDAVHKGRLSIERAVQLMAEKPSEIFSLTGKGYLEQDRRADLVVVDFNAKFKIDASKFKSKAKFSPFNGWEVQGKPVKTYVGGQIVMDEGEIVAKPGNAHIIRRAQK